MRHHTAAQHRLAVLFDDLHRQRRRHHINDARVLVRQLACGDSLHLLGKHVGNLLQRHLLLREHGLAFGGKRVAYRHVFHRAVHLDVQRCRGGDGVLTLILAGASRDGAACGLHHCKTLAVLGRALHIQYLIERYLPRGVYQCVAGSRAVYHFRADLAFEHRLSGNELYLVHCAGTLGTEHHLRRRVKRNAFLSRDKFFLRSHRLAARERRCALLDAAAGQRGNDLPLCLGHSLDGQSERAPDVHASLVDRPAVHILRLSRDKHGRRAPASRLHIHLFCERQLLFRLTQTFVPVGLVIYHAPQITVYREPARRDLLLQHHKINKALDDLEHLRQVVRDEHFGLHREFQFCIADAFRRGDGIFVHL